MRTIASFALGLSLLTFATSPTVAQEAKPAEAKPAEAKAPDAEALAFFEQKIRPVLAQHCYACHSDEAAQAKKLKAGLLVDSAEGLLVGGESGPAIVKGKSAESLLLKALRYDGLEMPPTGKLSAEVLADFAKWIDAGAADPRTSKKPVSRKREINLEDGKKFWSFQPLQTVTPPTAPGTTSPHAIDHFVRAKQAEKQLQPSARTSRERLIRRVYFDLIGLPPTPEQVAAFVADTSTDAFAKVVDQLLENPQYGERWARHWLDAARFAESGGYEFDGFRPGAYHYRDWVIRALNADLPYDQFVRMQLVGDKLATDEFTGAAAMGFLVAGPYPGQITAKTVERIRYDQIDDMMMTIGGSMLGLTLGCVRCHEHKYDPLPHEDYYALAANLARSVQGTRTLDPDPAATQAALEKHEQARQPFVAAAAQFAREQLAGRFQAWQTAELPKQPDAPRWQILDPQSLDAERSWLKPLAGAVIAHDGALVPGTNIRQRGQRRAVRDGEEYHLVFRTHQKNVSSLRLDALTDKSLPQRGPGLSGDGSFQLVELKVVAKPADPAAKDAPIDVKLKPVFAAFEDQGQPLAHAVDGKPETAWVVRATAKKDNAAVFELDPPLAGFAAGTELHVELKFRDLGIGRLRLAMSVEPNPATWAGDQTPQHLGEIRALLAAGGNKLTDDRREAMLPWFAQFDAETAKVYGAIRQHDAAAPRPQFTEVYTTVAGGQDVFFLRRGEVDNKQGVAKPGVLQVLSRGVPAPGTPAAPGAPAAPAVEPRQALADWLTSVDTGAGPLLARVIVNRVWQHHFGEGLVGTPNDFGAQGERPTHPELLEWLAAEFVKDGWSLKKLHRRLLASDVYQQSHEVNPDNLKIDPENRYLWHFQPRRLEAESIRDALLAVGGNMDATLYGPSVLDNSTRRSVYLRVKRSELIPLMTMFDAPEPTQSIGERISTTVPTQALAMMNSPFVRQQAERLAQRVRPNANVSPRDAIDAAYRVALGRAPSEQERAEMLTFVDQQRQLLGGDAPANFDKAFVEFCHVLLCLNEFVYVD